MIHPSAQVSPEAQIGENVEIGPYCIIGPNVKIGARCKLDSHVILDGHVKMGEDNHLFPFSCLGLPPQDLSYSGEPTEVIVGNHNVFREYVSVHRGTLKQDGQTIIGNHNLIMAYSHLGHDVTLGDHTRIVNACNFAGHVSIGDRSIISGGTVVGQFVRIGKGCFIGGGSVIDKEIPHFSTAYGNRIKLKGINIIGLKRMGVEKAEISILVDFLRSMEASNLSPKAFIEASIDGEYSKSKIVKEFSGFISESKIGIPSFIS